MMQQAPTIKTVEQPEEMPDPFEDALGG